jgi:hypothetical protein
MANKFEYNYKKISNPYNDFLERGEKDPYGIDIEQREVEVKEPFDVGDNVIDGNSISNLWISNWIKSRNYKPGSDGCYIDGKTGNVEFNKGLFRGSIVIQNTDDVRNDLNVEDGATAGADWNNNLLNIPDRHTDTATTGLNLTPNYLGYYDGSVFQSYIDSSGKFQFRGDDNNYINWNGTNLNVVGSITVKNPSDVRTDINVEDGADVTSNNTANDTSNVNGTSSSTIISGGLIQTDVLTADNIETGTLDADKVTISGSLTGNLIQTSSNSYEGIKMSSSLGGMDVFSGSIYLRDSSNNLMGYLGADSNTAYLIGTSGHNTKMGSYQAIELDAAEYYAVRAARTNVDLGASQYPWRYITGETYRLADGSGNIRGNITSDSSDNLVFNFFDKLDTGGADLQTDVWRANSDTSKYMQWANGFETNDDFYVGGDLTVGGTLDKSSGSFKIDHPLDPENKWLKHSFVESPDMLNVYRANAYIENGECKIIMPDWFIPLNGTDPDDYSYQLTSIGQKNNLWVKQEMNDKGEMVFAGEKDGKFSYMITAVRHDEYAENNRIQVEEDK